MVFANIEGKVFAKDVFTGLDRWHCQTSGPIYSNINRYGDALYLQADGGDIYKLKASSGEIIWVSSLPNNDNEDRAAQFGVSGWDYKSSTPVEKNGTVYVASSNGHLYALDSMTGQVRWKFRGQGKIRSTPAIKGNTIVVGSFAGHVYAVDSKAGKLLWDFNTEEGVEPGTRNIIINSRPTIADGVVYIGSRNTNLYALDIITGEPRWVFPYRNSWVETEVVLANGSLYSGSSFKRAQLSIDPETGQLLWQANVAKGLSFSRPTLSNDALYTGTIGVKDLQGADFLTDGGVMRLDNKTGKLIWRMAIPHRPGRKEFGVVSSAILHEEGIILFGTIDGRFYAVKEHVKKHAIEFFKTKKSDLKKDEKGELAWKVNGDKKVTLNGRPVAKEGTKVVAAFEELDKKFTLKVAGESESITFKRRLVNEINLAKYGTVYVSSTEPGMVLGSEYFVLDGDNKTRWSSGWTDKESITLDLGETYTLGRVRLLWEAAYATRYNIEVSKDATNWQIVHKERKGDGGIDELLGLDVEGRYVRLVGQKRATEYGYSLFEFEVYEQDLH